VLWLVGLVFLDDAGYMTWNQANDSLSCINMLPFV
jgi:hypothetical protein